MLARPRFLSHFQSCFLLILRWFHPYPKNGCHQIPGLQAFDHIQQKRESDFVTPIPVNVLRTMLTAPHMKQSLWPGGEMYYLN